MLGFVRYVVTDELLTDPVSGILVSFHPTMAVWECIHLIAHGQHAILDDRRELTTPFEDMQELGCLVGIHAVSTHPFVSHQAVPHLVVEMACGVELKFPWHVGNREHYEGDGFGGQHLCRVALEFLYSMILVVFLARHLF